MEIFSTMSLNVCIPLLLTAIYFAANLRQALKSCTFAYLFSIRCMHTSFSAVIRDGTEA